MCGIAGIVNFSQSEVYQKSLRRMIGLLHHRGPDAAGIYFDDTVGLAHARLSIIDLTGGDQPIHNEDKSVWIVFNGEIFNYPDLRNELISKGHTFYTQTDTEVLVHLYEELGMEMFEKLNGQFAFVIWDRKKQTLLLCRDRMGIRPLFYYQQGRRLVFGSEIKALFADEQVPRRINPPALSDIFTCWSTLGPDTPFEGVRQIPPAHYALFTASGLKIKPYWQLPVNGGADTRDAPKRPLSEWIEEFHELIKDATESGCGPTCRWALI